MFVVYLKFKFNGRPVFYLVTCVRTQCSGLKVSWNHHSPLGFLCWTLDSNQFSSSLLSECSTCSLSPELWLTLPRPLCSLSLLLKIPPEAPFKCHFLKTYCIAQGTILNIL